MSFRPVIRNIVALAVLSTGSLLAQAAGKTHVLLIGAMGPSVPKLLHARADIETMREALSHVGLSRDHSNVTVLVSSAGAAFGQLQPTSANVKAALVRIGQQSSPSDELFIYYTGHAAPENGVVYLGLDDAKKNRTSVKQLREWIEACKLKSKIVFLDCCYSGSSDAVSKDHSLFVMSSCGPHEYSTIWKTRGKSLATVWLSHGLRGGADLNRDCKISISELFSFVRSNVGWSFPAVERELSPLDQDALKQNGQQSQSPKLFRKNREPSSKFVIQPKSFEEVIDHLAQLIRDQLTINSHLSQTERLRVGVAPFVDMLIADHVVTDKPKFGLGGFGEFGFSGALRLTQQLLALQNQQGSRMAVVKPQSLQGLLKKFDVVSIQSANRNLFQTNKLIEVIDVLVSVQIELRNGFFVLRTDLVEASDGNCLGTSTTVVLMTTEMEMQLRNNSDPYSPRAKRPLPQTQTVLNDRADQPAQQGRPAATDQAAEKQAGRSQAAREEQKPSSPTERSSERNAQPVETSAAVNTSRIAARLELKRDDQWQKVPLTQVKGGEHWGFQVRKGDVIRIFVKNTHTKPIALVVSVDGINVLATTPSGRSPLEDIRQGNYWILTPGYSGMFKGWRKELERDHGQASYSGNEFKIVDAPKSVAHRLNYTSNTGMIRLHVFPTLKTGTGEQKGRNKGVAVGKGDAFEDTLTLVDGLVADQSAKPVIVDLRYSEEKLQPTE